MAKRLGELLIESGAVTPIDLEEALAAQSGGAPDRLGEILVAMGKLSPENLARALAHQSSLPFIDLGPVPPEVSDLVPLDLQVQNRLAPFEVERLGQSQVLHLAVCDPSALSVVEDLSMQIGMAIKVYVASSDQIEATHAAYQGQDPIVWPHPSPGQPTAPVAPIPEAPSFAPLVPPAPPKLKIPPAPVKPLPRKPSERPRTSPPPPPIGLAPTEKRPSPLGAIESASRAAAALPRPAEKKEPVAPEPLAGLALPDWLSEQPDAAALKGPDRALQLKLETLFAHSGLASPESALATVVALLIRRGVLREHEVLDALGRK